MVGTPYHYLVEMNSFDLIALSGSSEQYDLFLLALMLPQSSSTHPHTVIQHLHSHSHRHPAITLTHMSSTIHQLCFQHKSITIWHHPPPPTLVAPSSRWWNCGSWGPQCSGVLGILVGGLQTLNRLVLALIQHPSDTHPAPIWHSTSTHPAPHPVLIWHPSTIHPAPIQHHQAPNPTLHLYLGVVVSKNVLFLPLVVHAIVHHHLNEEIKSFQMV